MQTSRVCLALAVMVSGTAPLSADEVPTRVTLGAPVTPDQVYTDKKFNFTPSELTAEHRLTDDRFNYVPERDKQLTVQQAKPLRQ